MLVKSTLKAYYYSNKMMVACILYATFQGEARLQSYELKALAILRSGKKFKNYLKGIKFNIITDCSALVLTYDKKICALK